MNGMIPDITHEIPVDALTLCYESCHWRFACTFVGVFRGGIHDWHMTGLVERERRVGGQV